MATNMKGQIAVSRLARTLDPATVQGQVIMIPALNMPAVMNDTRLSPVDNRDMNRCFPGNPRGTFSEMLAHFIDALVLPHVDVSVDLHTCGHSGDSALSTNMHYLPDQAMREKTMAAAAAFGAPFNVVFWGVDEGATLTSAVERRGILSRRHRARRLGPRQCRGRPDRGSRAAEHHAAFRPDRRATPDTRQRDGAAATRHMMVRDQAGYSFAPAGGLFEPRNVVGDACRAGELAGLLHFVEDVDRAPIEVRYRRDGILWMSAGPGRVQRGDVVAVLMEDYDDALAAG